jgi:hypothetical protein
MFRANKKLLAHSLDRPQGFKGDFRAMFFYPLLALLERFYSPLFSPGPLGTFSPKQNKKKPLLTASLQDPALVTGD